MSLDYPNFEAKNGYYRLEAVAPGRRFIVGNPSDEDSGINAFIVLEVLEGPSPVPYDLQLKAFKRLDDLVRGRLPTAA